MAEWTLKVASLEQTGDIWEALESGKKKVDVRPADPGSKNNPTYIRKGDTITFTSGSKTLKKKVKKINVYRSVEQLSKDVNPAHVFPDAKTPKDVVAKFEKAKKKWGKKYAKNLEECGVVAITIA